MDNLRPPENHLFNYLATPVSVLPCLHKASVLHPNIPEYPLLLPIPPVIFLPKCKIPAVTFPLPAASRVTHTHTGFILLVGV